MSAGKGEGVQGENEKKEFIFLKKKWDKLPNKSRKEEIWSWKVSDEIEKNIRYKLKHIKISLTLKLFSDPELWERTGWLIQRQVD